MRYLTERAPLLLTGLAAITLGQLLQLTNGHYVDNATIRYLGVVVALCVSALVLGTHGSTGGRGLTPIHRLSRWLLDRWLLDRWLLGLGLALQLAELAVSLAPSTLAPSTLAPSTLATTILPNGLPPSSVLQGLFAVAALLVGASLGQTTGLRRSSFGLLLLVYFALGAVRIVTLPSPHIDVYITQRDAAQALLAGQNPHSLTFQNIYGHLAFYGPGLATPTRVLFGFQYPPLSLLFALPGELLGGDVRFSHLLAMVTAAAMMRYARPTRLSAAAASLLLFTPRALFVLDQSWTEPFLVLGLAAVIFCSARSPRWLPYVFGLALALKQSMIVIAPLGLLLLERPLRLRAVTGFYLRAAAAALASVLPFFLWDPSAFVRSVLRVHFLQPFRMDSLSFAAWWVRRGHDAPPAAFAFIAAGLIATYAVTQGRSTRFRFALATAVTFIVFFALSKQAFCNYYYLVIGALCLALASDDEDVQSSAIA